MSLKPKRKSSHLVYISCLTAALIVGMGPAALVFNVDPYEIYRTSSRTSQLTDIAEKDHYPLWKLAKFVPNHFDTVILGDSRARSLRDKYWHELGLNKAINLAYGGGTIPEIYSTFQHIKNDPSLETLVIGIQLRSFDEQHKDGMDRVPEAQFILSQEFEYLKNWSIAKTAWKLLEAQEKDRFDQIGQITQKFSMEANAVEFPFSKSYSINKLLDPEICYSCDLPDNLASLPMSDIDDTRRNYRGWGGRGRDQYGLFGKLDDTDWDRISGLYALSADDQDLPKIVDRQVTKNAGSDWENFEFSQKYWTYLKEISVWATHNNMQLVFVIPPTIEAMQRTITTYGHQHLNHQLRTELAKLAPVIDFDFSNDLTRDHRNFSDAYHFDSDAAKQIVGQIVAKISPQTPAETLALKRQTSIQCPQTNGLSTTRKIETSISLKTGQNCRIWQEANL